MDKITSVLYSRQMGYYWSKPWIIGSPALQMGPGKGMGGGPTSFGRSQGHMRNIR